MPGDLAEGDAVRVWSNAQQDWFDARVKAVLTCPTEVQGRHYPPETLVVVSAAGEKWVPPHSFATALGLHVDIAPLAAPGGLAAAPSGYQPGERVEVFSKSRDAWVPGVVLAAFVADGAYDGFSVPAGALKVQADHGLKWIMPEQVGSTVRKLVKETDVHEMLDKAKQGAWAEVKADGC